MCIRLFQLVSPVNGLLSDAGSNSVRIEPIDEDFNKYIITIHNVNMQGETRIVSANDTIGVVTRSGCEPNFIHLTMHLKDSPEGEGYIDPTPYSQRPFPTPRWVQECKNFKFVFKFNTVADGEIGKVANGVAQDAIRNAEEDMKEFAERPPEPVPPYRPQGFDPKQVAPFNEGIIQPLKEGFLNVTNMLNAM